MSDFAELLAVNSDQTLRFFAENLEDENKGASQAEIVYVAGILAHYAQTSRNTDFFMPPATSLYEILDNFVLPGLTPEGAVLMQDPGLLELAGSQTLLLTGFFRDQMQKKHNVKWYEYLGRGFFEKASDGLIGRNKAHLLGQVALHFSLWAISCYKVSRKLREKRYLLTL